MADLSLPLSRPTLADRWRRIDKVWLAAAAIPLIVAVFDPAGTIPVLEKAATSLAHTGIFIVIAVLAVGYMKATGSEALVAKAFEGREARMIVVGAALGGLSPFCSCEVIPFVAAMLAVGAPLSAVMAFWLASPLMDPAMFVITAGALGPDFALAKAVSAIAIGALGGLTVMALRRTPVFIDPLRETPVQSGCGCGPSPFSGKPEWAFWRSAERRRVFRDTALSNTLFLVKWMLLAYLIAALMLRYVPSDWIADVLGGAGVMPIVMGALIGWPAYLNGYAAVPLIATLLEQGMAPGAAMSFVIAGGISCIPAALAVWPLVKPRVFAAYLGFGFVGAVGAGLAWTALA